MGHSLKTYGWIWLIIGIILIAAGVLVLGPSNRPSAEVSRWVGIVAAAAFGGSEGAVTDFVA